ncbi:MAG: hypothetical protein KME05_16880 [Gloeocapsa sp. UFS-A4-WI-NPMV-4B04]|nr:hypothetical protein [Gloeocapsa sp. UFS-A4-WI-NPMV-4B04]
MLSIAWSVPLSVKLLSSEPVQIPSACPPPRISRQRRRRSLSDCVISNNRKYVE